LLLGPNLFLGYAYRKYYSSMFVKMPVVWKVGLFHQSNHSISSLFITG
jgi:hypothetical protein